MPRSAGSVTHSGTRQRIRVLLRLSPDGFKAKPVSWFPDGSHILVTSVAGPAQEPGLWQLSGLGGSPRKLSDDARDAAVSPDGSQIVFLRGAINSQELWLMGTGGEQP